MPKAKGKNAFYFFMLDWKKREEKCGRVFPNGLKDVQNDPGCDQEWRDLPKQKKGEYEAMAKQSKVSSQITVDKKNSAGESLREIAARKKKEQEFLDNMREYITTTVRRNVQYKSLHKFKFYIMHMNWFYIKEAESSLQNNYYCPAEFAIADFSFETGIENIYHEIVNIKMPLGFTGEALRNSNESHRIPVEYSEGEKDFAHMCTKIESFLQRDATPTNMFPPIYTVHNQIDAVRSLMRQLATAAKKDEDTFLIYSLDYLFMELWNAAITYSLSSASSSSTVNANIQIPTAQQQFQKDLFSFTRGLECKYHSGLDGAAQYCSMSILKRWAFTMCDHCCNKLDVKIITGVHLPKENYQDDNDLTEDFAKMNLSYKQMVKKPDVLIGSKQDKERRLAESKPISIIDHSKKSPGSASTSSTSRFERSLRLPNTLPVAGSEAFMENFPLIGGRGIHYKKKQGEKKPGNGEN